MTRVARVVGWGLLILILADSALFEPLLRPLAPVGGPVLYDRASLAWLTAAHVGLVVAACATAAAVAVPLAILVTRARGTSFLPLSRLLVNLGQTIPPVAVLAITVPLLGFGTGPTFVALVAYGLLPIFEGTLAGLRLVPEEVAEAGRGVGLSPRGLLLRVELPLALPHLVSGVRIAAVVAMGTATIGSTVAAAGLGEVIIAGLLSDNTAFVAQGGFVVALAAVLLSDVLGLVQHRAAAWAGLGA